MKTKTLTILLSVAAVIAGLFAGFAIAANEDAPGLNRVPVLIGFKQTPGPDEQALVRSHGGEIKFSYTLIPGIAASVPQAAIEGLRHNPNVTIVEPDIEVFAVADTVPWGIDRIGAPLVHNGGNKGAGVKVAVIDSGIDYNHSDLSANYAGGYDFANGDADPMDDNDHGTHVSGTIAADDNGSGVVGVAPDARLYGLKVLAANGSGSYSAVIAALDWAVKNGMQVTNNSYGSSGDPGILTHLAFDNAEAAGIINVCAAGNAGAGTDTVIYPAKYTSCIAVAAIDSSNTRASFSSTGPDVELAAPGAGIYSTVPSGGYATWSGTSMACPHAAGVAALVIAAGYGDVRARLTSTADDLGAAGRDTWYGYGLVDADEAAAAISGPPVANFVGMPTSGTAPLNVLFTDISTGLITSWSWNFGDGQISSVRDPSHTYSSAGSYTVTLTVSGPNGSNTDIANNYITASQPPVQDLTMHVADIVMSLKRAGSSINAVATVTVKNGAGALVSGATVYGHWEGKTSDSDIGTTDTSGKVALQSNKVKNPPRGTTFTFKVDNIVKSGWTYNSGANVETSDFVIY